MSEGKPEEINPYESPKEGPAPESEFRKAHHSVSVSLEQLKDFLNKDGYLILGRSDFELIQEIKEGDIISIVPRGTDRGETIQWAVGTVQGVTDDTITVVRGSKRLKHE